MQSMSKKFSHILITGATSGIGKALAQSYLRNSAKVAICGRNPSALDEIGQNFDGATVLQFDIRDTEKSGKILAKYLANAPPLDLAILNAGTHQPTDAANFSLQDYRNLIEVNLLGTLNCLPPVIDAMKKNRAGQLAIMGSVAGYVGLPYAGAYCASKSALMRLTETLRLELYGSGIKVRLISPGFVKTALTDKNDFSMPFLLETDAAAKKIIRGLEGSRYEIAFPRKLAWPLKWLAMLPAPLYFTLARKMLR